MNKKDLKNFIITTLSTKELTIKFTKMNGDEREIRCTRNQSLIPEKYRSKLIEQNEIGEILPVFDLDLQGWKSFYFDSVIGVYD